MSSAAEDEDASLAYARSLQAEYDRLAFASNSQEESPIEAEYRAAARLRAKHSSFSSVSPYTGWKSGINDGENSQQREAEVEANTSTMSDEHSAGQIRMQEDQFHSHYSDPSAASASFSSDSKGKRPSFIPFTPGVFTGPPSPPVSPLKYQSPFSRNPPSYSFHANDHIPQPPLLFPPSPQDEVPIGPVIAIKGSEHSAINGSINFGSQLAQSSRAHSPTVFPYRTVLTGRTMTKHWQDYYKKNMEA